MKPQLLIQHSTLLNWGCLNYCQHGLYKLKIFGLYKLKFFGLYKLKFFGLYKQTTECRQQRPLRQFAVNWDEMDEASALDSTLNPIVKRMSNHSGLCKLKNSGL